MTQSASARPDADIRAGYAPEDEFAKSNGLGRRTVYRYRNQPHGLPWLTFGGRVYIPIAEASDWLKNQVRRPNQRRAKTAA
jgi:hypothetical protein